MRLQDIMKALSFRLVEVTMHYDQPYDQFYLDLETRAKSQLLLYEDGTLRGRYHYEKRMDLEQDIKDLVFELCCEFKRAMRGRSYGNPEWINLCRKNEIYVKEGDNGQERLY